MTGGPGKAPPHGKREVRIKYPSISSEPVMLWRVLVVGGFARSIKDARAIIRAGLLYVDGVRQHDLRRMLEMGTTYDFSFIKEHSRTTEFRVTVYPRGFYR